LIKKEIISNVVKKRGTGSDICYDIVSSKLKEKYGIIEKMP